jgi:hypothetical protein
MPRTTEDILAQIENRKGGFLDFETPDLIAYLPFDAAKAFLNEGVTASEWEQSQTDPLDAVRDYLPFAWGKANDNRGLSADRSVQHLRAWLWLAGFDVNADFDDRYEYYGKPCLVVASEIAGFDWAEHDDGRWTNDESGDGLGTSERERQIASAKAYAASVQL